MTCLLLYQKEFLWSADNPILLNKLADREPWHLLNFLS